MTSYSATDILARVGLKFDVIYIDAQHDEVEAISDFTRCFELRLPGGTMFGDAMRLPHPSILETWLLVTIRTNRLAAKLSTTFLG